MAGIQVFSFGNEVFRAYAFYSVILALKMFAVVFMTAVHRIKNKVALNEEDVKAFGKRGKLGIHPDVERIRRAHLNDLENIIPFWIIALLYVATGPQLFTALMCFRIFTIARVIHSVVYIFIVPQPFRAIAFFIALAVNLFMIFIVLVSTF